MNKATITYNPNPYQEKENETDPSVTVKTYGYVFQKVDGDQKALAGAVFTLYESDGTTEVKDESGETVTATSTIVNGTAYVSFSGLASGSYVAKETTVPSGHVKAGDVNFTVNASTATADNPATTGVTETNYLVNSTPVVDNNGTALPSTGGMGTVAFTVVGAALVVTAGVLLVTRRRMQQ